MSIGVIFSNRKMSGSCGNSKDNPCECSFLDRINCFNKASQQ